MQWKHARVATLEHSSARHQSRRQRFVSTHQSGFFWISPWLPDATEEGERISNGGHCVRGRTEGKANWKAFRESCDSRTRFIQYSNFFRDRLGHQPQILPSHPANRRLQLPTKKCGNFHRQLKRTAPNENLWGSYFRSRPSPYLIPDCFRACTRSPRQASLTY